MPMGMAAGGLTVFQSWVAVVTPTSIASRKPDVGRVVECPPEGGVPRSSTGRKKGVLATALILALVMGLSPGVVWCEGPGGHLQLEPAHSACCERPAPPDPGQRSPNRGGSELEQAPPGRDECAGCIDSPLSSAGVTAAAAAPVAADVHAAALVVAQPAGGCDGPVVRFSAPSGTRGSPPSVLRL